MYYGVLGQLALLRGTIDRELGEPTLGLLRQLPASRSCGSFVPLTYRAARRGETWPWPRSRSSGTCQARSRSGAALGPYSFPLIGVGALLLDDT